MLARSSVSIYYHQPYKEPFQRQSIRYHSKLNICLSWWLYILICHTYTFNCICKKSPFAASRISFSSFFFFELSTTFSICFPSREPQIWVSLVFETFFFGFIFGIGSNLGVSSSLLQRVLISFFYNTLCHFTFYLCSCVCDKTAH